MGLLFAGFLELGDGHATFGSASSGVAVVVGLASADVVGVRAFYKL